jgi:RNA polymerase sigma factor (sigma-70 family)
MSDSSFSTTLLERAVAQEPHAWQRLVHLYGPLLYARCRRHGIGADDAPDIVQEVFLAAVRNIQGFRREDANDSFRGWLWGIARNKIKDHWEAKARRPNAEGGSDAVKRMVDLPCKDLDSPPDEDARAETAGLVQRALAWLQKRFADTTWQAFKRHDIDRQPASQVALELGISATAVRVAACRVRKGLRDEFAGVL